MSTVDGRERERALRDQPYIATVCLTAIALALIAAITLIRMEAGEIPAGLTTALGGVIAALAMASGRRRF